MGSEARRKPEKKAMMCSIVVDRNSWKSFFGPD